MSTPHGQGGGGRASKPPAPVVPTDTIDWSTATPIQQTDSTARSDPATAVNQTQNPFINRRLTGQSNTDRPARQTMSSSVGRNPPPTAPTAPSAMRKREIIRDEEELAEIEYSRTGKWPASAMRKRGPSWSEEELAGTEYARAAKRPANASTRSDLASGDVAVAHGSMFVDNTNEGPASSEGELLESMSPVSVDAGAAGMSHEPAYVKSEQTSAETTRPLVSKKHRTAASTRAPMTDGSWARPRSESMDRSAHGGYRQTQGVFSPGTSRAGAECRACGSHRHMTKECHVPSKDGTVVICPLHDCSVLDSTARRKHSLDGLKDYNLADRVKIPLYCDTVMDYKAAVRYKHPAKIRDMIPHLFQELVMNRRRKPCCRVVSKEICPINITMQYSVHFCHGKMPAELEGAWPYTKRDVTHPAICAKLQHFDELGWKGMPKGELEYKSWEQIKREYAEGIIPPQIRSNQRPLYMTGTAMPTAAGWGDTEPHLRALGTDVEPRAVDEDGGRQGSLVQEGAVQSQDLAKMDVIIQMLGTVTDNVDANPEQLASLSEKVAALATLPEKVDASSEQVSALSKQVAALSEQVASLSALVEKSNAISEQKKEALYKILDFLS